MARLHLGGSDVLSGTILGDQNATEDPNYVRKSAPLIKEALLKGSDVMQLSNGNIIITEWKVLILQYNWNKERGRFERAKSGVRTRRSKAKSAHKKRLNDQFVKGSVGDSKDTEEQLEDA
ncbi:hypothetical protein RLOatenuis_0210 [Rickettsiales bacterium]|nr:hypothetical protein RLOatenuis_0210 [Rickettsiales bacterium]